MKFSVRGTAALGAVLVTGLLTAPCAARDLNALALIGKAVTAQGGEARLRAVTFAEWRSQGYRNMVEQSERPQGPYVLEFRSVHELHDLAGGRFASVVEQHASDSATFTLGTIADRSAAMRFIQDRRAPGTTENREAADDQLALSSERLLLTALDASDLTRRGSVVLQSIPQDVLSFSLRGSPVTIYLNRFTHLPTAVVYRGPAARDGFWQFLGDVSMRTYYSNWSLGEGGVRLPMQMDIEHNGVHDMTLMTTSVRLNGPRDEKLLAIPPELRAAYAKQAVAPKRFPPLAPAVEVVPGVHFIPGPWNVTLVRQSDGIVILEAPISSAYSESVLAAASRLYPGVRIKTVVSTSDSWPHFAGLRAYVARGIPIYCLDLTRPVLDRLVQARFSAAPDALSAHPIAPRFIPIYGKTVIGSGANTIALYPIRGETSERQIMAYLPGQHLLYGSDPFQPAGDGRFQTDQAVSELVDAVAREKLAPRTLIMMHVPPTDWARVRDSVRIADLHFPDAPTP